MKRPALKLVPLLAAACIGLVIIGVQTNGSAYDQSVATLPPCPSHSASPSPSVSVPPTGEPSPSQPPCNPANLHASLSPATAVWGSTFTVSGTLACKDAPVPGSRIVVHVKRGGTTTTWSVWTNDAAAFSWSEKPDVRTEYSVAWQGAGDCPGGALAPTLVAQVRPGVTFNATKTSLVSGQTAHFYGKVAPAHPGARVTLQMYQGSTGQWKSIVATNLDANSAFSISYWTEYLGKAMFRACLPAPDSDHTWNVSRSIWVSWSM